MLHTMLVFVGIPLLVVVVISLLVMVPSMVKQPRLSPGQPWLVEPEWFGAAQPTALESASEQPQLAASTPPTGGSRSTVTADEDTGGASVRW